MLALCPNKAELVGENKRQKIPMLDLSNTQAKIIKAFIENYRDESGKISQGIAQKGLKKYGLEPKTFEYNKEYFLKNYFLRPLTFKQRGDRNELYFQITRLGVLAYLKWQSTSKISDVRIDRDFFPELFKYWGELVESFEQVFFDVLRKTLERMEIRPEFEGVIHGEKIYGGRLDESILIPMEMMDVKLFRKYKQPEIQNIPTKKSWGKSTTFETLNQEIDDKITQRFTFLLLFNLLHLGTNTQEFLNLMLQNYTKLVDNEEEPVEEAKKENNKVMNGVHKRITENTTKLFSIINHDDVLLPLMKSSISEITDMLANRKNIQEIYDKLV